jgi:hypothetical protein
MKKLLAKLGYMLLAPSLNLKARDLQNGMLFAEKLGRFLTEATESDGPVETRIICKIGDSDVTVLKIWATTDGNTPTNRVIELCEERNMLKARIVELEKSLR